MNTSTMIRFGPRNQTNAKPGRAGMLAAAVAALTLFGCDRQDPANKSLRKTLDEAQLQVAKADLVRANDISVVPDMTALDPARQTLAGALAQPADPALVAVANGTAGTLDLQVAQLGQSELIDLEQKIRDNLATLRAMSTQIALSNYLIAGYLKQNPQPILAQINTLASAIKGGADKAAWSPASNTSLPTLAAIQKDIQRLNADVQARRAELDQLAAERSSAYSEAESKFRAADAARGDASVAAFKEGAQARRRADELTIKADLVGEQLRRAEADLQIAVGQETALQQGIVSLEAQAAAFEQAWKALGQRTEAQRALTNEVYREGKGVTVDAQLTSLGELMNQATVLRTQVNEELVKADKKFLDASNAGKSLSTEIAGRQLSPDDTKNWNTLRASVHPNLFLVHQGEARRAMGMLSGTEAALLNEVESTRALVRTALDAAGLPVPSDGVSVDKQALSALIASAAENLDTAINVLQSCESGDAPSFVKSNAMVSRLVTYGALLQLEDVRQSMGEADAAAKYQQVLTDATDLKNQIVQQGLIVPALPGELGKTPAPALPPAPGAPAAPGTGTPE